MDVIEFVKMATLDGREAVGLLNAPAAHALYDCLITEASGVNRVRELAHNLNVSEPTIYAWCSNRATVPVAALRYCAERWRHGLCREQLTATNWRSDGATT